MCRPPIAVLERLHIGCGFSSRAPGIHERDHGVALAVSPWAVRDGRRELVTHGDGVLILGQSRDAPSHVNAHLRQRVRTLGTIGD